MVSQRMGPSSWICSIRPPYRAQPDRYHAAMGFNPFRPQHGGLTDVLLVAGTLLVAVALVLWAVLSG